MKMTLHLPGLTLVPAKMGDVERVGDLLREPEVRRYLCDDEIYPREKIEEILAQSDRLNARQIGMWLIQQEMLGFVGFCSVAPVTGMAAQHPLMKDGLEPVVAIHPRARGHGFASQAVIACTQQAAMVCRIKRLVANVDEPNVDSHRLLIRCGFMMMGRCEGPKYPLILYERIIGQAGRVRFEER